MKVSSLSVSTPTHSAFSLCSAVNYSDIVSHPERGQQQKCYCVFRAVGFLHAESLQVDFRKEQQQWLVSCVQVDKITPIIWVATLSHCLHTVNVTDKCTYNVFCPVGVDDTTVLGKLR